MGSGLVSTFAKGLAHEASTASSLTTPTRSVSGVLNAHSTGVLFATPDESDLHHCIPYGGLPQECERVLSGVHIMCRHGIVT
jgi:hypothetical protein